MRSSVWKKITICVLAGLLGFFAIRVDHKHSLAIGISLELMVVLSTAWLSAALLYIPVWQYGERKRSWNTERILSFWEASIIYFEALVFFRFSLLKILDLHMNSSVILSDFPAGSISNYHIMDYFFGRAPSFKLIIAALQIAGATTLLFKRTRLLGIFILMPVIANIVLMDVLYNIGAGITIMAALLMLGLIYLLWQDRKKLIALLWNKDPDVGTVTLRSRIIGLSLKASAFIIPLLILLPSSGRKNASILGKYGVAQLTINDQDVPIDINKDSILTTVYFDENATCLLRFNSYAHLKIGGTTYNRSTGDLKIKWRYPETQKDTSTWNLSGEQQGKRTLTGELDGQKIRVVLVKEPFPAIAIQ